MSKIIYLHGFLSSPQSSKAQQTKEWLEEYYPHLDFVCPYLPPKPAECRQILLELMQSCQQPIYLIGSSLGGFWASYLVEKDLACKAVLVNPAVAPHRRFREYIGQSLRHYYSDEHYSPGQQDIQDLQDCDTPSILSAERYWLMVQEGDEVLDYRQALDKYSACKQRVETGGDHSFRGYKRHLPAIMQFFRT